MRAETLKVQENIGVIDAIRMSPWLAGFKTVRCSSDGCSRWLTQRHLSARKVGVSTRGKWYCGYGCFARVAAEQFSQLLVKDVRPLDHGPRMPLGLILIQQGFMTYDQLKQAVRELDTSEEETGEALVRLGYVTEKQLISARSVQWGCPVFARTLKRGFVPALPLALMRQYSMASLHHVAATNSLLVGFVYGIEYGALYAIEEMTGCTTQACLITPSDFEAKMQTYGDRNLHQDDLICGDVQPVAKMVEILCSYGRAANADDIAIGRCRDYLWARMKNNGLINDVLFKAS